MIITSFMRVVEYPSNACLSCLDNGSLLLKCNLFRVSKCHRCHTSKQKKTLKYLSNTKALLTCRCLITVSCVESWNLHVLLLYVEHNSVNENVGMF